MNLSKHVLFWELEVFLWIDQNIEPTRMCKGDISCAFSIQLLESDITVEEYE